MGARKLRLVTLFLISLASSEAKLPFGMRPCPRDSNNFGKCVQQMASDAMSYILVEGRWMEIGNLDPVPVNPFNLNVRISDSLLLQVNERSQLAWRGLKNTAIRNFKYDLDNIMSCDLDIPSLKVDGPVIAKGHILDTQINEDKNSYPPVMIHFVSDEFTASIAINFLMKTNASGIFLFPSLKSFQTTRSKGTLKFENLLPADYSPGERSQQLLKKFEEVGAEILVNLTNTIVQKIVMKIISETMQMNTYDQFFPENELAAAQVDAGVAMTLTGSWLAIIAAHATVLLLGI